MFDQAGQVLSALRSDAPDVLDDRHRMPGRSGLDLLKEIQVSRPVCRHRHDRACRPDAAVRGLSGAVVRVILPKPFRHRQGGRSGAPCRAASTVSIDVEAARRSIPELLGQAAAMQQVFRAIGKTVRSSMTVLITGESAPGKNSSRALHRHSPAPQSLRRAHTAAFTADLWIGISAIEKAHSPGDALRRGRFEQADGVRCSSDESATCRRRFRRGCSACWPR